jgi:hypothetical protein
MPIIYITRWYIDNVVTLWEWHYLWELQIVPTLSEYVRCMLIYTLVLQLSKEPITIYYKKITRCDYIPSERQTNVMDHNWVCYTYETGSRTAYRQPNVQFMRPSKPSWSSEFSPFSGGHWGTSCALRCMSCVTRTHVYFTNIVGGLTVLCAKVRVTSSLCSCLFLYKVYRPLPPGGNPIAANKYHISSLRWCVITKRRALVVSHTAYLDISVFPTQPHTWAINTTDYLQQNNIMKIIY